MVARPFFLLEFTPFLLQIPVKKFQFLPAILVKIFFSDFEWIFSMVVFGIVVVVVVVTVTIGRRAGKKYIYPPCGQQFHSENIFFMMAGKPFFFSPFS